MKKQSINYKIELLSPAGDFEKLKYALIYGADACFIGGQEFSLRARSSNFTIKDITNACKFAHKLNKKIYVTTNIIPHDNDLKNLDKYLLALEKAGVDAIICASPAIITRAKEITNLELHLSTQQSSINSNTILFWKNLGITRVVLGRELNIKEINILNKHNLDIEVFVHGGMCMSYSGRCSLSNTFTNRDANRGGCAHSCRWDYRLFKDNSLVEDNTFSLSSKDLLGITKIPDLIKIGVNSLKIEGRMKSLHYVATVTKTYRMVIDEFLKNNRVTSFNKYLDEINNAENRETEVGYLDGNINFSKQIYEIKDTKVKQSFVGLVRKKIKNNLYLVEERNNFKVGETLEILSPDMESFQFKLEKMMDLDYNPLEVARHAKQEVIIEIPKKISDYSIIRKV